MVSAHGREVAGPTSIFLAPVSTVIALTLSATDWKGADGRIQKKEHATQGKGRTDSGVHLCIP